MDQDIDLSEFGRVPPENMPAHASMEAPFSRVQGRRTVDALLQATTQDLVVLSGQADLKGSVLVTACCLVISLAIGNFHQSDIRPGLLVLVAFSLPALVLAALAIVPSRSRRIRYDAALPLFFRNAAAVSRVDYVTDLARVCERDAAVYEAIATQIHELSCHLERTKFKYLRWGYLCLISGVAIASVLELAVVAAR